MTANHAKVRREPGRHADASPRSHVLQSARYAQAARQLLQGLGPDWTVTERPTTGLSWLVFRPQDKPTPAQGWKIHLSTSALDACECIQKVPPVLIDLRIAFKLPSSLAGVVEINSGRLGLTQTGKVITAYPAPEVDYTELIRALQDAWPSTNGPHPLSDLLLGPDSSISVRFGSFTSNELLITPEGRVDVALLTPEGTRVPDSRTADASQPAWAPPCPTPYPFLQPKNGLRSPIEINGCEYFPICLLQHSAKGHVALCTDRSFVTYVVKTARRGVLGDLSGTDARSRLKNEFHYLQKVSHLGLSPLPLHLRDGPLAMTVLSDVQGVPLSNVKHTDRLRVMLALATAISRLHAEGVVHRDIKPQNVLIAGDRANLIDLELACDTNAATSIVGGTWGYFRQDELTSTDESRDVYALGMCVAQALMDYDPPLIPGGRSSIVQLLRTAGKRKGAELVYALTQPRGNARPTAAEAAQLLVNALPVLVAEAESTYPSSHHAPSKKWMREASLDAGRATRRFLVKTPQGHYWRNSHLHADLECEAINIGAAGIILGLLTLETAFGVDEFTDEITKGANHLASKPAMGQAIGLFTGHAGVGLALVVAGLRYGRDDLIEKGKRRILAAPLDSMEDFFAGLAGVAWTACVVGDLLDDPGLFDFAAACAARICKSAISADGLIYWEPSGPFRDDSPMPLLGAAHGATGIAMVLAHVGRRLNNERARRLGLDSLHRLWLRYQPLGQMPMRTGEAPSEQRLGHWCHGTVGFVWSLLQLFGDCGELTDPLHWGIETLNTSQWLGNPTYCHGVSGHLEVWRMAAALNQYQSIGRRRIAMALTALKAQQHRSGGHQIWSSEESTIVTPDLWVGFLAPATALALAYIRAPWRSYRRNGSSDVQRPSEPTLELAGGHFSGPKDARKPLPPCCSVAARGIILVCQVSQELSRTVESLSLQIDEIGRHIDDENLASLLAK